MAAVRPFLARVQAQAKRFADLPEVTRNITPEELLEDVRTAHYSIYEDYAKMISPEARYWRAYWDTAILTEDQRYLTLPPTFRRFAEFLRWDDNRKVVINRRSAVPGTDGRTGVILHPHTNKLEFIPYVYSSEAAVWELTFETSPCELHYGVPQTNSNINEMTFATSATEGEIPALNDFCVGATIHIVSGIGMGQYNQVKSYNGPTKVATMVDDWETQPTTGSIYEIRPWVPGPAGIFDEIIAWRMAMKYRRMRADDGEAEREAVREIKTLFDASLKLVSDRNTESGLKFRGPRSRRNNKAWK